MSLKNSTYEPGRFDTRDDWLARRLKQDHVKREKRVADGAARAEELRLPKLPKGMASAMHAYSLTSQARSNSKYLDSLLKRGNAKP
jgi:hypothetical protein